LPLVFGIAGCGENERDTSCQQAKRGDEVVFYDEWHYNSLTTDWWLILSKLQGNYQV